MKSITKKIAIGKLVEEHNPNMKRRFMLEIRVLSKNYPLLYLTPIAHFAHSDITTLQRTRTKERESACLAAEWKAIEARFHIVQIYLPVCLYELNSTLGSALLFCTSQKLQIHVYYSRIYPNYISSFYAQQFYLITFSRAPTFFPPLSPPINYPSISTSTRFALFINFHVKILFCSITQIIQPSLTIS